MACLRIKSNIRKYDEKIMSLDNVQFRVWFDLLCLASENCGVVDMDKHLYLETHCGNKELFEKALSSLSELEIIKIEEGQILMQYKNVRLPKRINKRDMERRNTPIFEFVS